MIDHSLMETLEYRGLYGARYRCFQCSHYNEASCKKLNNEDIKVNRNNNICRLFEARIKNPSAPNFEFDEYLEFLMSDFYRPWCVDAAIVVGSARLGEVIIDGGELAKQLPDTYSPYHKSYDKPYCRIINPLTVVSSGKYKFELDYRLYRENSWLSDGVIKYKKCYWKRKPSSRSYQVLCDGELDIRNEEDE